MRVLLIEDDLHLCEILTFELERENFIVDVCNDGEEGLYYILQEIHDIILLDQMLPSMNGMQILETIRKKKIQTPVIFVTALGESADKIKGLNLGADDYIVKPFDTGELLARIRSILRRPPVMANTQVLSYEDIRYYPAEKKLEHNGTVHILAKKEGELLELFMISPEKVLNRQQIISKVWGPTSEIEDGNLDNYIYLLRRKLASINSILQISTIRGVGYCLVKRS